MNTIFTPAFNAELGQETVKAVVTTAAVVAAAYGAYALSLTVHAKLRKHIAKKAALKATNA